MRKVALLVMAIILAALLAGCAKGDKTPPVISEISASGIAISTATITWTTDEPATSQVEYGLTTSYGSTATPSTDALVTSHSVALSSLDENTTYHYRVKSKDASDNEAASGDYTFTTSKIFPDENLETAVREAIGKPTGNLLISDLEGLTELDASERDIVDVTGLEYCANLVTLDLPSNQISDISSLSNLTSLEELDLEYNQIADITAIEDLSTLTGLNLSYNQINDISPLANLTNLTWVDLAGNEIVDISPLQYLTSMTSLHLIGNRISDINPLANLTNLTQLFLSDNQIAEVTPLASLIKLRYLHLSGNQIDNIDSLADLTDMEQLALENNQISDISALENLTSLEWLWLEGNQISGVDALSDLTELVALYLDDNQIVEITALSSLTKLGETYLYWWLPEREGKRICVGLQNNQIEDISALVGNEGLSEGDGVDLRGNPLSTESLCTLIPQFEARGVEVLYDEPQVARCSSASERLEGSAG